MRKILFVCLFLFLIGCKTENKTKIDVSHIDADVTVARFDVDFYNSSKETLSQTKKKYPMLFPHDVDSVWVNKINNKDEQELFAETQKLYKDFSRQEKQLENLFQHVQYYNEKFQIPTVITMLTNMDNRVVYADKYLFVSLDNYLGRNHEFYAGHPKYIRQNNTKEHLIVDVANTIIDQQVPPNPNRRFIDKMIYEGKKMYLLDAYLPDISDQEKIGYTPEKFDWAVNSEENIWRYFIDRDLLYSTDNKLNKRFLDVAGFSKFYLSEDNKSPGQIGVFIGWQIVRSYMQNNDVSLRQLMKATEEEIFTKSKYKPKR